MPKVPERTGAILLAIIATASCGVPSSRQTLDMHGSAPAGSGSVGQSLDQLEAEQQRQAERLARIRAEIAESERRAEIARRRAAIQQCRATAASIDAEVALQRAQCAHDVAAQQACLARQERGVTDSALGGCGLGVLAGVLSGGALAGWALAGCGAGLMAGELDRDVCPAPTCIRNSGQWLTQEAGKHQHMGFPLCHARADINERIERIPRALVIRDVVIGSAAESAGLRRGDILLGINGHEIQTSRELRVAIRAAPIDAPSTILFLRNQRVWSGRTIIGMQRVTGDGRRLLGITYQSQKNIRFPSIAIAAAEESSEFRFDDQVIAIDGRAPANARATMEALASAKAAITVTVRRGDEVIDFVLDFGLDAAVDGER